MKAIALFARTTIVGGVFFLAPIVVLIVILTKAFGFAKTGLQAVVPHIPGISDLSFGVATALSIAMIALVCILAGLIAHTLIAQRFVNALEGAVTRTEFGRLNIGELDSDSGCGGGSPRPEGSLAEDAERAAGCEMALDVKSVVDGGVNGQEALG
jgi:hypothetical protein